MTPVPRGRLILWALLVPIAYAPSFVLGARPDTRELLALALSIALAFGAVALLLGSRVLDALDRRLGPLAPWTLVLFAIVFTALSTAIARQRLAELGDYSMVGLFSQSFWTLLHGHPFANSHETLDGSLGSHFGVHFSPTLLIATPFYRLWPQPLVLLVFQALAIGLVPVPVYALLAPRVGRAAAAIFGLAAVPMMGIAWFGTGDFFDANFLPVLLLAAVWALERRRWGWFVAFALSSLGVREEMGITIAMLGVYAWLRGFGVRTALAILALGAVYFVAVVSFVIPHFSSPGMWMDPKRFFVSMFGQWGNTPAEAVRAMLTHPVALARALASRENAAFLYHLLRPYLLLPPFGDWAILPALPGLAVILLSRLAFMRGGHYADVPATFLALATLYVAARTVERAPEARRYATGLALALIVLAGTLPSFVMSARHEDLPAPPPDAAAAVVRLIPPGVPVYAPVKLYPRLCNRDDFGCWWSTYELGREPQFRGRYRFIVLWPGGDSPERTREAPFADSLAHDPRFVERPGFEPFLVYERR